MTIQEVEEIVQMNFDTFVENVTAKWVKQDNQDESVNIGVEGSPLKFKSRNKSTGHWLLTKRKTPRHFRWSTVLYSDAAHLYEPLVMTDTTTQTLFHALPEEKKHQLYRAYYELIVYMPWKNTPNETFLSKEVQDELETPGADPETTSRYSNNVMFIEHIQ
jgi:hypothetical protein